VAPDSQSTDRIGAPFDDPKSLSPEYGCGGSGTGPTPNPRRHKMHKLISGAIAAAAAITFTAGAAAAHVVDTIPGNEVRENRQGGTPFGGFVGPVEGFVGSEIYVRAHSGMECGALRNPKMTALGPVELGGIGFDDRFICPSAGKGR
jgi:hypothetical protein